MRLVPVAYLLSYLLSLLGNSIAGIALPLIVLQTTGSALGAGTVAAATALPAVAAGLLMGVVIDRINRRTSSVVTDLISAAAIAALPLVDLLSGLSLGWFVVFGIIGSLGDVPGMTARDALLPAVVRHSGVSAERMMGMRESLGALALLLGPAAAGTLMLLFDGSTVLWLTAATSLSAALLTLLIPHRVGAIAATEAGQRTGSAWGQLHQGWRALWQSPFLRATTALSLVSTVVLASLQGLILPVYFTQIAQPGMLGFVLTAVAVGMLAGGGIYTLFGTRGRRRTWFIVGLLGSTAGFAVLSSLASTFAVFGGAILVGLSSSLFSSLLGVLMIERIPEQLRGRIMGTQNAILTAAPAAGIAISSVFAEYAGVHVAALAIGSVWLLALGIGLGARSLRTLEKDAGSPAATEAAVSESA